MLMRGRCRYCGRTVGFAEHSEKPTDEPERRWYEYYCICGAKGTRALQDIQVDPEILG